MALFRSLAMLLLLAGLGACNDAAPNVQYMNGEDFAREFVGVPLCGTPQAGPLAGKPLCTIHMADGTAVVAGSGVLARGRWASEGERICRRDPAQPPGEANCVRYQRLANSRYRNSDGIEFCIGPCS
jgi:hypothetical protein